MATKTVYIQEMTAAYDVATGDTGIIYRMVAPVDGSEYTVAVLANDYGPVAWSDVQDAAAADYPADTFTIIGT